MMNPELDLAVALLKGLLWGCLLLAVLVASSEQELSNEQD